MAWFHSGERSGILLAKLLASSSSLHLPQELRPGLEMLATLAHPLIHRLNLILLERGAILAKHLRLCHGVVKCTALS